MQRITNTFHHTKNLISVLLLFVLCCSCNQIQIATVHQDQLPSTLSAEILFINGNFKEALEKFQEIYKTSTSEEEQTLSLYGIACSQMMLAKNDAKFLESIKYLQKWDAQKGSKAFTENRHLLVLALVHQSELLKKRNLQARKKNSVIAYQKKKIQQMSETLENLRTQLTELENLDENFQELKKPL